MWGINWSGDDSRRVALGEIPVGQPEEELRLHVVAVVGTRGRFAQTEQLPRLFAGGAEMTIAFIQGLAIGMAFMASVAVTFVFGDQLVAIASKKIKSILPRRTPNYAKDNI
jgi:hypothetical protein